MLVSPLKLLGMHGSGCGISFWVWHVGQRKTKIQDGDPGVMGSELRLVMHQVRGWRAWSGHCGARRLDVTWGSFSRAGGDWEGMGFHLLNYLISSPGG